MSMNDFQILAKLGEGAFSSVYKVKRLVDDVIYALKKVKLTSLSQREIYNAVNEVRILASIRHPNIICYKEAFYDSSAKALCIVMEYADGGDLLQRIFQHKKKGTQFKEDEIWDIFTQIVKGLSMLHDLKILHRDVKSANVFLMKNGVVKIGDMNVSKVVRTKDAMCETQTGTPFYASPEVWRDEPYDAKSDIWSLGCVLYEFINLKPPFRARDMEGLYRKVSRGYYSRINKLYSEDLSTLLRNLIRVTPQDRLSCHQIIDLPIVKNRTRKPLVQVEEKSILLRTIKLSKNINYLTEKLPKPNYSPLRLRSHPRGSKSIVQAKLKSPYDLQLSLPPIKSRKRLVDAKSERFDPKKRQISLPKIVSDRYVRRRESPV